MKILIVDDNANNRMVLSLLLQDYSAEKKEAPYEMVESANGLDAFEKVQKEHFDLIFMDIMMPQMDGIEATEKIRAINKEVMIIAVSAVDDELRKKEILRNGAEDYVPKPIDSEQLFERLDNYISLLRLRHHENLSSHTKAANLYTKEIFRRQTIFYVSTEEALSEFWEYYLLGDEPIKVDNLSDVVRLVFSLGESIVQFGGEPWIIVEADHDAIYFTLNKIDIIGSKLVRLMIHKNKEIEEYKLDETKISFRLEKRMTGLVNEAMPVINTSMQELLESDKPVQESSVADESFVDKNIVVAQTDVSSYDVFPFMDAEDLIDTEESMGDLSSLMLVVGNSQIELHEVHEIADHLERLSRYLGMYSQSQAIAHALYGLSQEIRAHDQRFLEIAADLSSLSSAFVSDLKNWYKMTFKTGAPSVDFMNDTISSNAQMIAAMLADDGSGGADESMDDIFDF